MEIVKVPIESVKMWDKNPRSIRPDDYERLKKQIVRLGFYKPLIAIKEGAEYVVLGGNMRLRALKDIGVKEVDLSVVEAPTVEKQIEYALSDNDQVGFYDTDLLSELVVPFADSIPLEDFKIELSDSVTVESVIEEFTDLFTVEDAKKGDGEEDKDKDEDKDEEGEEKDEFAGLPGGTEGAEEEDDKYTSIKYGELDGLPIDEDRVYCSLHSDRFDVARGVCPNNCLYCYIKTSPAGKMNMPLRHVKREEIRRMVLKAKGNSNFIITGLCMDPLAAGVEEPLLYLFQNVISKDMQIMVLTKDPKKLFSLLTKELKSGFRNHVFCRTSFSHPNPTIARKLEPNAPNYDSRLEGLRLLESVGVSTVASLQPFFPGHTEYQDLISKIASKKILCEALRANKSGAKYYQKVMLTIGEDLLNYYKRWGNPISPIFGNMHWFDYNVKLLNAEFRKIRDHAAAAGKGFGSCGGMGYQCAYLNTDEVCCQIGGMKVKTDPKSLASLIHTGEYKKLHLPYLNSELNFNRRSLCMDRLGWLNDPNNPIFDEETGADNISDYKKDDSNG